MEDERKPERRTHVARDLEQTAVLAAEPYRDHGGFRALDELRHKRLPALADAGLEAELVRRGRYRARGEHHHLPAFCELGARCRPGREVGQLSFLGA